jgi:fibronectin type 3 domain-containing protein
MISTTTVEGADLSSALSGYAYSNYIQLNWEFPTTMNGFTLSNSYYVYRGYAFDQLNDLITNTGGTDYQDHDVGNGAMYYYVVVALYSDGTNSVTFQSNEISINANDVPDAPTDLRATPGDGKVALSWTPPPEQPGLPNIYYHLYYRIGASADWSAPIYVDGYTYVHDGLENGVTYTYTVAALNPLGEGVSSDYVSATPTPPIVYPTAPTDLTATPGNGQILVSWNPPAEDGGKPIYGYDLYWSLNPDSLDAPFSVGPQYGVYWIEVAGISYLHTGLQNGVTYYYLVDAITDGSMTGQFSDIVSATPSLQQTAPSAPTGLNATAGSGQVQLNWTAPSSDGGSPITGYKVFWSSDPNAEFANISVTGTSYLHTGLQNEVTYYYRVTAINSVGEGQLSDNITAMPTGSLSVPSAPINPVTKVKGGSIELNWDAPTSDGGSPITEYVVYRGTASANMSQIATVTGTTYTDGNVQSDVRYFYTVAAANNNGVGPPTSLMDAIVTSTSTSSSLPTTYIIMAGLGIAAVAGVGVGAMIVLRRNRR